MKSEIVMKNSPVIHLLVATSSLLALPLVAQEINRTVLPIHEPVLKPITTLDARDAKAPPRFDVKAPQGAPNVVIVLIDDIGFGHSAAFGGPIKMPTLEKLAGNGLKYNRFHTTALCSPTRTAKDWKGCNNRFKNLLEKPRFFRSTMSLMIVLNLKIRNVNSHKPFTC